MSHFYESLHPEDTDPRHQGEPVIDLDLDEPAEDEGEDDDDDSTR